MRLPRRQQAAPAATTRRSPFWRLWVLRLPRREPAATIRAATPSGGSGYCACHEACHEEDSQRHQRRQRAPQPLLEPLGTAPATRKTASGTSGDNARRSPFWRLWVLRLPRGRQPAAPAATTRAPSAGSGYCACHEEDSQRRQRRQPAPLLEALGIAPATRKTAAPSRGSGYCACHEDSKRHRRRQRAPQPLLEALGTAPATRKTASGTSGDNPRRNPLLEALDTAPATRKTASGDNARRSPFWSLWILRLPRGRQPAAPAATTRAAAPSAGSGYCACHEEDSQRRQPAPQPLLEVLDTAPTTRKTASGTSGDNPSLLQALETAPATRKTRQPPLLEALHIAPATKTASGTSGDNARRSPFWRLWVLRLPRREPAATIRAATSFEVLGTISTTRKTTSGDNAPQPLLQALGTAPATKTASGVNPRRNPF